jgi:hypothetical protein
MTDTTLRPDIDRFAKDVRAALKDLSLDEVAELTEGLEADLAAQADEQGRAFALPDPNKYAAELREAAGLPIGEKGIFGSIDRVARRLTARIAHNRILHSVTRFLASFAPVWWLARGYVAFVLIQLAVFQTWPIYTPNNVVGWIGLVMLVFGSAQFGRRAWTANRFWTRFIATLNVFAIVVAVPTFLGLRTFASEAFALYSNGAVVPEVETGLKMNSQQVDNIFVYDENGDPLTDVQLFDQDGDPISVKFNSGTFPQVMFQGSLVEMIYIESPRAPRGNGWNVFPLSIVPISDSGKIENGEDMSWDAVPAPLPFPSAPALKKVDTK